MPLADASGTLGIVRSLCPACGHEWGEHIPPEPCSECRYEIEHGEPDAPSAPCKRTVPPSAPQPDAQGADTTAMWAFNAEPTSEQERALLTAVRAALLPYAAEGARVQTSRIDDDRVFQVSITPTNSQAAAVNVTIARSDELVLTFGQTHVYLHTDDGELDEGLADMLDAIFAGRFDEAGQPGDGFARLRFRDGRMAAVGSVHLPLPWRLRRHRRYAAYRNSALEQQNPQVDFVGFAAPPTVDQGGLYQFDLAGGVRVQLHDCNLTGISYQPGAVAVLVLDFVYDPDWVPAELAGRPLIRLTFEQARIVEWDEDDGSVAFSAEHPDAVQEVRGLDWNGADSFDLQTSLLRLIFVARRVSVTTEQVEDR